MTIMQKISFKTTGFQSATQAINIVREFIKYDISESLTEFLQGEQAFLSVMKNDKNEIIKNVEVLESQLRKLDIAKKENPLLAFN